MLGMALSRKAAGLMRPLRNTTSCLRRYSTKEHADIESILAKPTWSVRSLLPSEKQTSCTLSITPQKLRHLLRLSALPQPSNAEEEQSMLQTLESQIHFVKEMQQVDTVGVEPLRAIRDETPDAVTETTIGLDQLRDALAMERVSGRSKRIQRVHGGKDTRPDGDTWDNNALGSATKTKGKYFVVETAGPSSS